jgi:hypothetical protein
MMTDNDLKKFASATHTVLAFLMSQKTASPWVQLAMDQIKALSEGLPVPKEQSDAHSV